MKRSLALLLASFLVVFSLTACGNDDNPQSQNDDNSAVIDGSDTGNDNSAHDGLTGQQDTGENSNHSDQNHAGDSLMDDVQQGVDDVQEGVDDAVQGAEDAMDDAADKAQTRNAYPHDKDGDLTDQENGFARNSLM